MTKRTAYMLALWAMIGSESRFEDLLLFNTLQTSLVNNWNFDSPALWCMHRHSRINHVNHTDYTHVYICLGNNTWRVHDTSRCVYGFSIYPQKTYGKAIEKFSGFKVRSSLNRRAGNIHFGKIFMNFHVVWKNQRTTCAQDLPDCFLLIKWFRLCVYIFFIQIYQQELKEWCNRETYWLDYCIKKNVAGMHVWKKCRILSKSVHEHNFSFQNRTCIQGSHYEKY